MGVTILSCAVCTRAKHKTKTFYALSVRINILVGKEISLAQSFETQDSGRGGYVFESGKRVHVVTLIVFAAFRRGQPGIHFTCV